MVHLRYVIRGVDQCTDACVISALSGLTYFKELDDVLAVALHHSEPGAQRLLQGPVRIHSGAPPPREQQHNF